MKRFCLLTLALCLLLCLTACGGKSSAKFQEQFDLGFRYLAESNYEEAIIAFTAAIEIDPKSVDAYTGLANVYLAAGEYEKADAVWAQARTAITDAALLAQVESLAAALPQAREFFDSEDINPEYGAVKILSVEFDRESFRAEQETDFTVIAAYQMPEDSLFCLRLYTNTEDPYSNTKAAEELRTLPRRGVFRMNAAVTPVIWPSGHYFSLDLNMAAMNPDGIGMSGRGHNGNTVYFTPEGEPSDYYAARNAYGGTVFTALGQFNPDYIPFDELPQVYQELITDGAALLIAGNPAGVVDIARERTLSAEARKQLNISYYDIYTEWNGYRVYFNPPLDGSDDDFEYDMELILRPENGTGYWFDSRCYSNPTTKGSGFSPYEKYTFAVCPCSDWQWNGTASITSSHSSYHFSNDPLISDIRNLSTSSSTTTGTMVNSVRQGVFELQFSEQREFHYTNRSRVSRETTAYRKIFTYENGFLLREERYDYRFTDDDGNIQTQPDEIKDRTGDRIVDLIGDDHNDPDSQYRLDYLYW